MDIHRCRFVPYPPSAINALAFSHASTPNFPSKGPLNLRLAIGRANGDIEIWNPLRGAWYQESVLRGGKDRSIEALVWTEDPEDVDKSGYKTPGKLRLFSIGYSTAVTEWELASGRPARHSAGNYGEIWCMAAQPKGPVPKTATNGASEPTLEEAEAQIQNIAVGCSDGSIVLLNTREGDLRFSRILARPSKKNSRVLSIAFRNRYTIIAGHADSTIRIYDIRSHQQMRTMTLGAGPKGGPKEILVWSVKCLADGTVVSGDSTGTLSFWDGKNYTLLQRIKSHEADILDIAISADGQSVFSGGMDRRTTLYQRTGSGRSGAKLRWAKIAHQRLHRHDVKAMATFETKSLSILASGGLDTAPVIVPIQEFGRENHRTLSIIPQQPILKSAAKKRLVISWWDREISIWTILRSRAGENGAEGPPDVEGPEGRKLLAKITLQGEESITSADLSSDGRILAISTMAELKLFHLRLKSGSLKVQKLEAPKELTRTGAKSSHISPDMRWLAVVRADNSLQLHRITESENIKKGPDILPKVVSLKRLARDPGKVNYRYGSLGDYDRSISHLAFSADSRILAVADLSGFLDTWVLEGHEDLTQGVDRQTTSALPIASSDDEDSDADSDEEEHATVILGQHWIRNPSASLLIKLPAAPLILSFRPSATRLTLGLTNGSLGLHPTRHTPHPHSHDLPNGEDRLFIVTAENQMYEFNILSGKISDWSRRNPTSSLPRDFRDLRDRAMGSVWDVRGQNERIWIYGVAWLWMFDLARDLPALDEQYSKALTTTSENGTKQLKRKREQNSEDDLSSERPRHDTGAGSKVPSSEIRLGIGTKVRRIKGGEDDKGHSVRLDREENPGSEDEESDHALADENDMALISLRRGTQKDGRGEDADDIDDDGEPPAEDEIRLTRRKGQERLSHWHTYKYRPILGIVPLGGETDDEASAEGEGDVDDESLQGLEVALVERPLWDLDLPPQYYGNREWDP